MRRRTENARLTAPRDASVSIDEEYIGPLGIVAARGVRLPVGEHRITVLDASAEQIGRRKADHIIALKPDVLASANPGCSGFLGAAGVTVVVDSDCHRAEALGRQLQRQSGLGAERGAAGAVGRQRDTARAGSRNRRGGDACATRRPRAQTLRVARFGTDCGRKSGLR